MHLRATNLKRGDNQNSQCFIDKFLLNKCCYNKTCCSHCVKPSVPPFTAACCRFEASSGWMMKTTCPGCCFVRQEWLHLAQWPRSWSVFVECLGSSWKCLYSPRGWPLHEWYSRCESSVWERLLQLRPSGLRTTDASSD